MDITRCHGWFSRWNLPEFGGLVSFEWSWIQCQSSLYPSFRYDQAAALKKITQPTLLLQIDGDVLRVEIQDRALELRPDFEVARMDGTPDVIMAKPQEFSEVVAKFLGERP
mmetsp:Transcript_6367/g.12616  ORF Transcript_6367/g.12616 Transcript_6367/m.12616 type:complete len:111 (-) Transcript_6367:306-638(-)